jgi:hypothetical protein
MHERGASHNAEQEDGCRSETADAQAYIRPPNGGTSGGAVVHVARIPLGSSSAHCCGLVFAHDVRQPVARLNRPR